VSGGHGDPDHFAAARLRLASQRRGWISTITKHQVGSSPAIPLGCDLAKPTHSTGHRTNQTSDRGLP